MMDKRYWSRKIVVGLSVVMIAVGLPAGALGSSTPADGTDLIGVHPQEFVAARLSTAAREGDRTIVVEDASRLDPRATLLIKSTDGRVQEVHCVKSVSSDRVKLARKLKHDFSAGSSVIQTSLARDRGPVATLSQPSRGGGENLVVADTSGLDALQRVVIQTPDRRIREAHCIRWVEDSRVRLAGELLNDFPADSALVQGDLIAGELAMDKPCCCDSRRKCCTDRLVGTPKPTPPPPPPPLTVACQSPAQSVVEGGSTRVETAVGGADPGELRYSWTIDGNPLQGASGPILNLPQVDLSAGTHVIQAIVKARDDRTASCDFLLNVQARPNRDPVCRVLVEPGNVTAGEPVQIAAEASDPDGDPLTYSWTLDEQPYSDTTSSWTLDSSPLSGGHHLARVAVRDGRGGLCSSVGTLSVREKIIVQIDNRVDNVAKAQLDEIALKLQSNRELITAITGHTDSTGATPVNRRVGMRRAALLRDYLVSQHQIDPNRIEVRSAGSSQPIASNLTAEGRQRNRRAEVELYVPGS